jgi:hypothetical protein
MRVASRASLRDRLAHRCHVGPFGVGQMADFCGFNVDNRTLTWEPKFGFAGCDAFQVGAGQLLKATVVDFHFVEGLAQIRQAFGG